MSNKHWAEQNEKAGGFLLKMSFLLVKYSPKPLLNLVVWVVSLVYTYILKDERKNILVYRDRLSEFVGDKEFLKEGVHSHFRSFAEAISDKFAVYQGKVGEVKIINKEATLKRLKESKRGEIFIMSHFGNTEISTALSSSLDGFVLNILAYDRHSVKFNNAINSIKKAKVNIIYVNELNMQNMMLIKDLLDKGEFIGVSGDRVPLEGERMSKVPFLGHLAKFNQGPYLLAAILDVPIQTLWCQKINGVYEMEIKPLAEKIVLSRDREASILLHMQNYVNELEARCVQTPYQWYNFYDFWQE